MGNTPGKQSDAAYNKPFIRGLPDALPYFEARVGRLQETRSFVFSSLDWEHVERPLHACGQALDPTPVAEMKGYRPVFNPLIVGATTATFPRRPNPAHNNKTEWMSHPIADSWFMEVGDTCAFGAVFDGSGQGHRGWAAAHLALVEARHAMRDRLKNEKLRSSVDLAKVLQRALMAVHNLLIEVDEAHATTAAMFIIVPIHKEGKQQQYGMVYAAIGDVEMYRYGQDSETWQSLVNPFTDLRFKDPKYKHGTEGGIGKGCGEYGKLKQGMNLQYGAVRLGEDDVIVMSTDGLGDTLDPIAARVPPKQVGQQFTDWHHFAKSQDLGGPNTILEIKVQRLTTIAGPMSPDVNHDDMQRLSESLMSFAMAATEGERKLYSDPSFRGETGKILHDKVEKARAAGLASGDYSYAKMDHLGLMVFAPKCMSAVPPRPRGSNENAAQNNNASLRRASMNSLSKASHTGGSTSTLNRTPSGGGAGSGAGHLIRASFGGLTSSIAKLGDKLRPKGQGGGV